VEVQAITKYVRISPSKANDVARVIRGMGAAEALDTLTFVPRKAARIIRKTLHSAVANAQHEAKKENISLDVHDLVVKSAEVGTGPLIKRWLAVARGSAHPILKRTSHVKIVVTDEIPVAKPKRKPPGGAKKAAAAKPQPAAAGGQSAPSDEKKA
jgi:large subunit ribosomal protein L22